jgi:hypothetical protein
MEPAPNAGLHVYPSNSYIAEGNWDGCCVADDEIKKKKQSWYSKLYKIVVLSIGTYQKRK